MNELQKNKSQELREVLKSDSVKNRFQEILRERAPAFITSIINVVDSSADLQEIGRRDPVSIIRCAAVAAALNLPIEKSLGFSWIVPYKDKGTKKPQFQIGYKGLIQLALRTGQYKHLNAVAVHKNRFKSYNALTEDLVADFQIEPQGEIVGYAAYFELMNGFKKCVYKSKTELLSHGKRYSQSFGSDYGSWKTHADDMCLKTLLKIMLSKWGIMSVDMQRAQLADQAVINDDNIDSPASFEYPDNPAEDITNIAPVTTEDLPAATELNAKQQYEKAKAILFGKKGKTAVEAILACLEKDIKDHSDAELLDLAKKFEVATNAA